MINYFVSYMYDKGFGCCNMLLEPPLRDMSDIKLITKQIKE